MIGSGKDVVALKSQEKEAQKAIQSYVLTKKHEEDAKRAQLMVDAVFKNLDFDHVIKFSPDCPPAPHNEEQHAEMERWTQRLQEFMEKENQ